MSQHPELGRNRTGIASSRRLSEDMIAGTAEFPPYDDGDEREIARERAQQAKNSEPLGSVPPPATLTGIVKTASAALRGESPTLLLDKLGERLSSERTAVRLYEALLSKYDALGSFDGGPTRPQLEDILREEFDHFRMLEEAVALLGGDSTVLTPSAGLGATLMRGVLEVLVDPRTSFAQCLEAILVAELVDHEAWTALTTLMEQAGEEDLAVRFARAQARESEQLRQVRRWLAIAQDREAP